VANWQGIPTIVVFARDPRIRQMGCVACVLKSTSAIRIMEERLISEVIQNNPPLESQLADAADAVRHLHYHQAHC
jgi:hypothetical protein